MDDAPTQRLSERLDRVEELQSFADRRTDQLADQMAALERKVRELEARLRRHEERLGKLDERMEQFPPESGDSPPPGA